MKTSMRRSMLTNAEKVVTIVVSTEAPRRGLICFIAKRCDHKSAEEGLKSSLRASAEGV